MKMQINLNYTGAQSAIASQQRKEIDVFSMAGQTIEVERNGQAVKLTFSDELIDFSSKQLQLSDLYTHEIDKNDPFSYKPNDQWLIFSQFLYDEGVFEGKTMEEVNSIENTLQNITDGLDSLSHGGISFFGQIKEELDSHEAQLELGASVAALQLFSEKYLTGETKENFHRLIDQYKVHNQPIAAKHQSLQEKFYAARAKVKGLNANLTPEQANELAITNAYSKQQQSVQAKLQQVDKYQSLFSSIQHNEDINKTIEEAKQMLTEFALQNINKKEKDKTETWLENRTKDTFSRIQNYFMKLM